MSARTTHSSRRPIMPAYTQCQHLNYAAPQLFDLVADVERYPEFMPWVIDAHVQHRNDHSMRVGMTVAAGPLRKHSQPWPCSIDRIGLTSVVTIPCSNVLSNGGHSNRP